jgi:two-component system LytT family response regulator
MILPRTEKISVLVVDDEAPARQRLTDLIQRDGCAGTILEAENGIAAVSAIEERRPDLVFLDVQMPELDGLGVMEAIGPEAMPLTIFVTAYDQHAVRAFEANALDYLLKPFSDERFEATMARVRSRLDASSLQEFSERLIQMVSNGVAPRKHADRLVVKSSGATRFVRVAEIDWIEAAGVYVNLHVNPASVSFSGQQSKGREILYRSSLVELAERLDPAQFIRVHRSTIVNIESILQLEPVSHGEFDIVLRSGARTRISRSYRALLEVRLGHSL